MKTAFTPCQSRSSRRGSAVIVVLAMIGIMMTLVTVNLVAVRGIDRELKSIEKKQLQRLNHGRSKQPGVVADRPTH